MSIRNTNKTTTQNAIESLEARQLMSAAAWTVAERVAQHSPTQAMRVELSHVPGVVASAGPIKSVQAARFNVLTQSSRGISPVTGESDLLGKHYRAPVAPAPVVSHHHHHATPAPTPPPTPTHHHHTVAQPTPAPTPVMPIVENPQPVTPAPMPTQPDPTPTPPSYAEPTTNSDATQWVDDSGQPLYGPNGPAPDDVYQGEAADCYFLAGLSTIARQDPNLIEQHISDEGNGDYAVQLEKGGQDVIEQVDSLLPADSYGNLIYAKLGSGGSTWVAVLEKAFAEFRSAEFGQDPNYGALDYGGCDEPFSALGSPDISGQGPDAFASGEDLVQYIEGEQSNGRVLTFGTNDGSVLVGGHVYSVVGAYDDGDTGEPLVQVRNPWGTDGPNGDGYNAFDANDVLAQMNGIASAVV